MRKKKDKQCRKNLYLHELCCLINKTKNYFICCSDNRNRLIFFRNAESHLSFLNELGGPACSHCEIDVCLCLFVHLAYKDFSYLAVYLVL